MLAPSGGASAHLVVDFAVFATRSRIDRYRIAPDLSRAAVELTVMGRRVRYDGCTGELESSRPERHEFRFGLRPTTEPQTTVDVFCRDDGAGGMIEVTETFTMADAAKRTILDSEPVTQTFGSLQHFRQEIGQPC